jgi:hypothetical protein
MHDKIPYIVVSSQNRVEYRLAARLEWGSTVSGSTDSHSLALVPSLKHIISALMFVSENIFFAIYSLRM